MNRVAAILALTILSPVTGAEEPVADKPEPLEDDLSTTRHSLVLDGEPIEYTATAGRLVLRDEAGDARAAVFHIAYARDGVDDPGDRPVMFSFNGGPGAAALWVNLGAFGPKKVLADEEGRPLPPPGRLVDNTHSVLDLTDLVFIDPVSTGFSRAAEGVDPAEFHGLEADVRSVGEFIRLWLTRNERWASPKFIAGESYGTTRAAALARHLQSRHGIYVNGIVMISSVLNFQNQEFDVGNDMANLIYLPSYTATAWYHGELPPALQERALADVLDEAERFALGDYAMALLQGDDLPEARRREIAAELARLTGLSPEFIDQSNLRIYDWRFRKELLRDRRKTVGRLDSRFTGRDRDAAGEAQEYDPSMEAVSIGYVALMNDYVRRDLGFRTDLVYESLSRDVRPWSWDDNDNRYVNVAEQLRRAMVRNQDLHVLFCCGYYDFATPYFDTKFTVSHLRLPPELRPHVTTAFYEAGHMMYIREADHAKMKRDVAAFLRRALAGRDAPVTATR